MALSTYLTGDLATTINADDFGVAATYTPAGGAAASITVIFDNEYSEIDMVSGSVSSSGPAAHCRTTDVPTAKKGDSLTVAAVNYSVTTVKPDGTGMTVLLLRKA